MSNNETAGEQRNCVLPFYYVLAVSR